MELCQACQQNKIEVIETCDNPEFPYKLCSPCHNRLLNLSLRPLEYFNLAAKHGNYSFLLHDDFYEEDGTAAQPEIEVPQDNKLAFPKLTDIKNDLEKVIDYSLVFWFLNDEAIRALKQFDKQLLLTSLEKRINESRKLDIEIYAIVATILGTFANDWVRKEWRAYHGENFFYFAECLAKCLPPDEGFNYIIEELDKIDSSSKLNEKIICLIEFHSQRSLDWIERNIYKMRSLSGSWGTVAAASQFDWITVKKWLNVGRPLSLIALDALANCSIAENPLKHTERANENLRKLLRADSIENMNNVLYEYLQRDNVPRTRNSIKYITENWSKILKSENES